MNPLYNSRLLKLTGLILGVLVWLANASNPPTGTSGAPFDGHCNSCHTGNTGGFDGTVTVDGMPSTVESNTTYPLMITMTPTAGSPVKAGFQLVAVDGNNANAGDLTAGNAQSGTEFFGGREYLEQRGAKNFTGGSVSWSFNWKSPVTAGGSQIKFYFIGNFTNGNNNSTGDYPIAFFNTYAFNGPPPVTATISSSTNVGCFGGATGSATVDPGGGVAPYTYHWSNNQNVQTATNLTAGTYSVTVTGSSGSGTATASVTITQPTTLNATASVQGIISCINQSVTATVTPSGGTPPYSYLWVNGSMTNQAQLTTPGSNSVTVTDDHGCTKVTFVTVTANTTPPTAVAGPANASITCQQPTTTLSGTGSTAGAAYLWTASNGGHIVSGATTLSPVVNAAGTYTLVVTNNTNGCTASASTSVTSSIQPPTVSATAGQLTCTTTAAQLGCTTSASPATFSWVGPGGFTSAAQNPTTTVAGTYTVTVTNTATGCSNTATAVVSQNTTPPTASATGGVLTCTTTSVQLTSSTNAASPTFSWAGPNGFSSAQQNPTVSQAGTYTVTIGNPANGCTSTATASVTLNTTAPTISATGGTLTCATTSVNLNATSNAAGSTFAWAGPNNFTSTLPNPATSTAGTYTVVVFNPANGCTASTTTTVGQSTAAPSASATAGQLTCTTLTATLNATTNAAPAGFAWSGPNGFTSTLQNPTTTTTGVYAVIVTDSSNGCTSTATVTVLQNTTPPVASAFASGNLNCNTASVQLNGAASSQGANFTYLWTTANGNIVSGGNTLTPVVGAAGTYTLLVTNTGNGCTATTTVTVNQSPVVNATIGAVTNITCNGGMNGSLTASGSGGNGTFTYAWSNSGNTATISNLPAGTYIVSITDGENCTATATATVTQPAVLAANATATSVTSAGATDGTATAAPTGGTPAYTYLWSTNATTATISGLAPGSYTVSVTDANGCSAAQVVTVNSFNCSLAASIASTNVTCNGANNGTATVSLTGAALPVTYAWSNGNTTATASGLAPGTYTANVTDANNCPAQLSVSITEPTQLSANASSTNESALGSNDGTASATPAGGTSPYSYAWSSGGTTATITGLAPGSYTVVVTDAHNCTAAQTVTVSSFNCARSANISTVNISCAGGSNGQATVLPAGATLPIQYAWSNNATTATISNLSAGTYTVILTDAAGCILSATATLTAPPALTAQITNLQNVTCPEDKTGAATVEPGGGTMPYQLSWPNGSNGQNLGVGTYTVSITDGNGCTLTQAVTIASFDSIPPTITCPTVFAVNCPGIPTEYSLPTVSDNCNLNGSQLTLISGLPSGSVFPPGQTTQVFQVTDASGNKSTCSFTIFADPPISITLDGTSPDVNNTGVGSIDVTVTNGVGPFTFAWFKDGQPFANTEDLTGLKAGAYTLVVTSTNGCTATLPSVKIDNTVGTNAPDAPISLRVIPNPVRDLLKLEIVGIQPVAMLIIDMNGRLIRHLDDGAWRTPIDVSMLPTGVYYLNILSENGSWNAVKWIKAD